MQPPADCLMQTSAGGLWLFKPQNHFQGSLKLVNASSRFLIAFVILPTSSFHNDNTWWHERLNFRSCIQTLFVFSQRPRSKWFTVEHWKRICEVSNLLVKLTYAFSIRFQEKLNLAWLPFWDIRLSYRFMHLLNHATFDTISCEKHWHNSVVVFLSVSAVHSQSHGKVAL